MLVCTACLHIDDRTVDHCPSCGETAFARVTKNGHLTSVPAEAGMPCQSCFATERDLKLRYYRRVLGLLIMDRIWAEAGYFCASCRRTHFARNMAFTLALGWWGFFALLFRNPYAITVNLWALFRPPFGAGQLGAIDVAEVRATAASEQEREQRLADVYMRMPGWMETLSEDDVHRILANVDHYAILGVGPSASHTEIKTAWRDQVKAHHPDVAGAPGHDRIVAVNDAWHVLGDERLRHAYDHRDELLAFLQDAEAVAAEFDDQDPDVDAVMVVGCLECRLGFETFDDAADHVDAVHPHTDYQDVLVSLVDDENDAAASAEHAGPSAQWRCKVCPETFSDYDLALDHADRAHPDRVTVDPRSAVEAI
jgi:rubrerythrin